MSYLKICNVQCVSNNKHGCPNDCSVLIDGGALIQGLVIIIQWNVIVSVQKSVLISYM